jgi:hypothetical protein
MDTPRPWLMLLLAALATWRLSHLLVHEDGPWDLASRLRARAAGSELGRALDCLNCTSLWLAAPVAAWLAPRATLAPLLWLALSGAAVLLERLTQAPLMIEPAMTIGAEQ